MLEWDFLQFMTLFLTGKYNVKILYSLLKLKMLQILLLTKKE